MHKAAPTKAPPLHCHHWKVQYDMWRKPIWGMTVVCWWWWTGGAFDQKTCVFLMYTCFILCCRDYYRDSYLDRDRHQLTCFFNSVYQLETMAPKPKVRSCRHLVSTISKKSSWGLKTENWPSKSANKWTKGFMRVHDPFSDLSCWVDSLIHVHVDGLTVIESILRLDRRFQTRLAFLFKLACSFTTCANETLWILASSTHTVRWIIARVWANS